MSQLDTFALAAIVAMLAVGVLLGVFLGWLACLGWMVSKMRRGPDGQRAALVVSFFRRMPIDVQRRVLVLVRRNLGFDK